MDTPCKIATGNGNSKGYRSVWFQGKTMAAHRIAWIRAYGPIPTEMYVLHRCDNPGCINPEHLFLGTNQDNMNDMVEKDRQSYGEAHGKIPDKIIIEIRKKYATRKYTQSELSKMYNISNGHINKIVHYVQRRDV